MRFGHLKWYFMLLGMTLMVLGKFPAWSQPSSLLFKSKGNLNDNALNFINDILFDSKNRVWIGAQTGFYRYDGYHYFPYRKTKDPNSLPNNFVHTLCEDKSGNIWGSTHDGIFKFDPTSNHFSNYRLPDTTSLQSVFNIAVDKEGNIWASTFAYLYRFNTGIDTFDIEAPLYPVSDMGKANRIKKRGLLPSADGKRIWATTDEGVFYFDVSEKSWKNIRNHPGIALFAKRNTSALAQAQNGNMLFFDIAEKQIVEFEPNDFSIKKSIGIKEKIPDANGAVLFQSSDKKIWFSNWFNDVAMIDPEQNNRVILLKASPNDPLALPSNFFWCAKQDKDGTIWFGTTEGIITTNPQKELFRVHAFGKRIDGFNEKTSLQNFIEDKNDHTWWIHTSDQQIIHYDPFRGQYTKLELRKAVFNSKGLKPKTITGFCFMGKHLVITSTEGAWILHKENELLIPIEKFLKISLPVSVQRMTTGEPGVYYLTDGNELYRFDSADNKLNKIIIQQGSKLTASGVKLFEKDNVKGPTYAAFGLSIIGKLSNGPVGLISVNDNAREINMGAINDIEVDSSGNVWICYSNLALMKYNPKTGQINRWDENTGMIVNAIAKIAIDHNQNVWTQHRRHFSVLLSGNKGFFNYSYPKGEINPTWFVFMHCLQNGNIVANNFDEIIEFFPARLLQKPEVRLPDISSVFVNDIPVNHAYNQLLKLNPGQNSLRIQFGSLTDRILFPYELYYKLDGADKDWKKAGTNCEAVYNKLPPGNYTFRVKAISKNDTWQTGEQMLSLKILKPFYKTTWFWAVTALALAAILYALYLFRLSKHKQIFNLESKTAALEREKATIQYDSLKQQLNPHFLFNSLTSLAGLIEADQQMAGDFLQRMSDMYRYILKNGSNDTVKLADEIRFVQLYIDIQQTRFGKGLQVHIDVPVEYREYNIAPVTLQNMLENAIKHNIVDEATPLIVRIFIENDYLVVANNLQKKNMVESSNKTGLTQFTSLYRYLSEKPVIVEEGKDAFVVKIPLL